MSSPTGRRARTAAAVVLALPLLVFGSNYFIGVFPLPPSDGSTGAALLDAMRSGGLMSWIAASHVVVGALLLVPRTRFVAALLQLPITIGMVAFHLTMLPAGIAPAAVMLLLNLGVLSDPSRLRGLAAA